LHTNHEHTHTAQVVSSKSDGSLAVQNLIHFERWCLSVRYGVGKVANSFLVMVKDTTVTESSKCWWAWVVTVWKKKHRHGNSKQIDNTMEILDGTWHKYIDNGGNVCVYLILTSYFIFVNATIVLIIYLA